MTQPLHIPNLLADQSFKTPHFAVTLKTANGTEIKVADPRASRALISLMDMGAVLGGAACHYGGPAALAELMSALHGYVFHHSENQKRPWYELFHVINDAGHCENGLYALKANYEMAGLTLDSLKKFRSIDSPLTGHGETHCFPQGVYLSNGPLGSAFPQSQGLAMADAHSGTPRVTYCVLSDGASMEGEAKEAFAAIPGFAKAGKLAPFVLLITDNNTKLTGRIDKDSFSMTPTFESLKALGWHVIDLEDGHNLQKCYDVISEATQRTQTNPHQPVAIHARTIKGYGHKKSEDSASGGHGFPLKSPTELTEFLSEIYRGPFPDLFKNWIAELVQKEQVIKSSAVKETGEKIQKGVAAALIKGRRDGFPIVSITSDLPGSTGVADFRKEFPQASFDVGVAESNMISTAVGFSKAGYIPVVDTFAQFGVTKGALPLTMASLSQAPVIGFFSHTGFQDAADGASHQALSYLSMVSSIPHVQVYGLSCSDEAESLVSQAVREFAENRKQGKVTDSYVFFLGRENFPKSYGGSSYKLRQAQVLVDHASTPSKSVALVTWGSLVPQAMKAAEVLRTQGYGVIVVNCSCLNSFDEATFKPILEKTKGCLVTMEDHQLIGGYGAYLSHQLSLKGHQFKMSSLAVLGQFGQSAYNAIDLYRQHGLDSEAVISAVRKLKV